jgi:hypothetical protein
MKTEINRQAGRQRYDDRTRDAERGGQRQTIFLLLMK